MIRAIDVGRHLAALILGTSFVAGALPVSGAESDAADGKWHFSLTPYLWVPWIEGTVTYVNPGGKPASISAQLDPSNYLESLDFAAMITGEARKERWLLFADYMYIHFGGDEAAAETVSGPGGILQVPVNVSGAFSVESNVLTLAGGYAAMQKPGGSLDVFAGARLLNFDSTISWNFTGPIGALATAGNVSYSSDTWDAIIGVKGEVRLGQSQWFMPYYADLGAGPNNRTWQAQLGLAYRFGWGEVVVLLRTLAYNFDDVSQLALRMTGPALGATFRF